jgi:hypothetical protein
MWVKNQPEKLSPNSMDYLPGSYFLYNPLENKEIKKYKLYRCPLVNSKADIVFDNYLHSIDRIKPDNRKIAMAMEMLSQINILDIETGKLIGVRIKETPDFKDLASKKDNFSIYYTDICVDDDYIYSLYANVLFDEKNYPFVSNEIHVFDWKGTPIRKIILDKELDYIALEPIHKKIYAIDTKDEIYSYDVSFLY